MSKLKKRILVVCPGRGTYTAKELGYLKDQATKPSYWKAAENLRESMDLPTIESLDSAQKFSTKIHLRGENAAALIFMSSVCDFLDIPGESNEVVGLLGNSMGWYSCLGLSGALPNKNGFLVAQTMGAMMRENIVGAQLLYPLVGENWVVDTEKVRVFKKVFSDTQTKYGYDQIFDSIFLGGYSIAGGTTDAINHMMKNLPVVEDVFPLKLAGHAAFHTPLVEFASQKGLENLGEDLFGVPKIPLVDGRGKIWDSWSSDPVALRNYTLKTQVTTPYDFTKSIEVGLKELAPDKIVLLGPGSNLGGAIAQVLIQIGWLGLQTKSDFVEMQNKDPFLIAMGRKEQRQLLFQEG